MLELNVDRAMKNWGIGKSEATMLKACNKHVIVWGKAETFTMTLPWDSVVNKAKFKARIAADKVADIESYIDDKLVAITTLTYEGRVKVDAPNYCADYVKNRLAFSVSVVID